MDCDNGKKSKEKPAPKDEPVSDLKDEKSPEEEGVESANAVMKKFLEKSED